MRRLPSMDLEWYGPPEKPIIPSRVYPETPASLQRLEARRRALSEYEVSVIASAASAYAQSEQEHRRRNRAARRIQSAFIDRRLAPYSDTVARLRVGTGLHSNMDALLRSMAALRITEMGGTKRKR